MKVPVPLTRAFGPEFESLISRFATQQRLLPEPEAVRSRRFLSRSVVPHVQKLSRLFNRQEQEQSSGLDKYWKESSNPANLRLAYFLYFMPCNLYRIAAIWSELARLGFRWKAGDTLRGIELGAGPASGACGIAAGEHYAGAGLPQSGNWALIEQDKAMLELGAQWASEYFPHEQFSQWSTRTFHRTIDFSRPLLPGGAPKFNLWVMSFFLNEASESASKLARTLIDTWEKHLDEEGVVILSEPALKLQSRRLLELRKALIEEKERRGASWLQVLLPCLGEQGCGALGSEEDWCHEEVTWWRPPYFRTIDDMASLDRKTLPFSYLVLTRSSRSREEILPAIADTPASERYRLVSPAHAEGKDLEFFVCGQEGKRRARFRPDMEAGEAEDETLPRESRRKRSEKALQRGDLLLGADIRGETHASRIGSVKKIR